MLMLFNILFKYIFRINSFDYIILVESGFRIDFLIGSFLIVRVFLNFFSEDWSV